MRAFFRNGETVTITAEDATHHDYHSSRVENAFWFHLWQVRGTLYGGGGSGQHRYRIIYLLLKLRVKILLVL